MFMETDRLDIVHEMILRAGLRRVSRDMRALKSELETAKDEKRDALASAWRSGTRADRSLSKVSRFSLEKLGGLQKKDFLVSLRGAGAP